MWEAGEWKAWEGITEITARWKVKKDEFWKKDTSEERVNVLLASEVLCFTEILMSVKLAYIWRLRRCWTSVVCSPLVSQSSDAIEQHCRGAGPQGGRGRGEGAPTPTAPFSPLQPPVCQHEEQVLQWAHTPAKWAHTHRCTHVENTQHTQPNTIQTHLLAAHSCWCTCANF